MNFITLNHKTINMLKARAQANGMSLFKLFWVFEWQRSDRLQLKKKNIRWQRNQVSKKTNYDKMSFITSLSFRSTHFSMPFSSFPFAKIDRKVVSSQRFYYSLLKIY